MQMCYPGPGLLARVITYKQPAPRAWHCSLLELAAGAKIITVHKASGH